MGGGHLRLLSAAVWVSSAHGGSTGSSTCSVEIHSWFTSRHEYFHLENWILATLVVMTMLFEIFWHYLVHKVDHIGHPREGDHKALHSEPMTHAAEATNAMPDDHPEKGMVALGQRMKNAYKLLHHRGMYTIITQKCAAELMILGFLAWGVWTCARAGLFYYMACQLHLDSVELPATAHGYQETIEDVHMHLFLSMCAFIGILTLTTFFLNKTLDTWKVMDEAILKAYQSNEEKTLAEIRPKDIDDYSFTVFFKSRYLFESRLAVALNKPDAEDRAVTQLLLSVMEDITEVADPSTSFSKLAVQAHMETWFPFHEYATTMVHTLVEELAEFKNATWFFLAIGLIVSAVLIQAAETAWAHWAVVLVQLVIALAIGLVGPLWLKAQHTENFIEDGEAKCRKREVSAGGMIKMATTKEHPTVEAPKWVKVEAWPMFSMQLFVFYWCYNCVRLMGSNYWWYREKSYALASIAALAVSMPIAGYALAWLISTLALMFARGDMAVKEFHLNWVYGISDIILVQFRRGQSLRNRRARGVTNKV